MTNFDPALFLIAVGLMAAFAVAVDSIVSAFPVAAFTSCFAVSICAVTAANSASYSARFPWMASYAVSASAVARSRLPNPSK